MRLKDKVAIVTGGASGIGRATAVRFAKEGAKVAIIDIDARQGNLVVTEIKRMKGEALFVPADIADEQAIRRAAVLVVRKFGRIDILVNNAVKFLFRGADATVDELNESLRTNVIGHHVVTRCIVPEMKKAGGGSIVFVGSISSVVAQPNALTYNAAKGAILQMSRCYAQDLAPTIRVNCVSPGHVLTPAIPKVAAESGMSLEAFEEMRSQSTLLKRVADPSEIANAILFIASDEASYITGANLMVDAGYTTV